MAQPQNNVAITAPGFAGLNTQDSPLSMDPSYASVANNCVIDNYGRIASRRGFTYVTTNPEILNGNPIVSMDEFVSDVDGSSVVFCAGDLQIFKQNFGSPNFELEALTLPVLPAPYVITADNWQMVNFNNKMYFVQANHEPLVYDPATPTELLLWTEYPPNIAAGDGFPNCAHAAFGRLWLGNFDNNSTVVAWSGILDGQEWDANGAGSLQTAEYWPSGFDEVVALAAHNNFMIIFGKNNILLYTTTSDVINSLRLADTVEGIGCIARDSVVPTGRDFMFIDSTGVRSLMRTIQEKSIPLGDISRNVRQDFQSALTFEQDDDIKGVFHHEDNFYACFLPSNPLTYVFDTWAPLPEGAARVTLWIGIRPRCATRTIARVTYFAGNGGVYTYSNAVDTFLDPDNAFEPTFTAIPMEYCTHPMDFGSAAHLIFPKQVDVTIFGGLEGTLDLSWGYDYADPNHTLSLPLPKNSASAFWGEDYEWSAYPTAGKFAEWSASLVPITQLRYNIWGSGRNVKVCFRTNIFGSTVSIQEINIQVLQGRIL